MDAPYRGFVVSHTHWDRAWYLPFQSFRFRLVRAIDSLLVLLDRDRGFRAFALDGQTVLLEDYLEIRPERASHLQEYVKSGRLSVGPWYTMPDLFLASGEAIVRNLQIGQRLAEQFGGSLAIGYAPDPFGHFAQIPQILRGFGIDTYIFMRGLDAATKKTHGAVFDWAAPDGSTVTAVYQREGYFPMGALGHPSVFGRFEGHKPDMALAEERVRGAIATMAPLQRESALLLSNGFDHMPPQPELPHLLARLNADLDEIELEHATLSEFTDALQQERGERQVYRGDLLGNADQPILSSVYSTRMYLKQQNHRSQQLLVQYVEPFSVWMQAMGLGADIRPFWERAWKLLLQNHPHDDICGCSVDAVHDDAEYRTRQIEQIADAILVEHLERLQQFGFAAPAQTASRGSDVWVFNPHPHQQRYRVITNVLFPNPDGEWGEPPPERQLIGCDGDGRTLNVAVLNSEAPVVRSRYLETTWGRRYDATFVVNVPPLGYQLVRLNELDAPIAPAVEPPSPVLENASYRVEVVGDRVELTEKETGTFFPNVLQFEYQLDRGDTYSFGPAPECGPWWATLMGASWHPQRCDLLQLRYALDVPLSADADTTTNLELNVWLELDETRSLAVTVMYENCARDGRLRAVFPVGFATDTSLADGHFRLAERCKPPQRTPESDPECYGTYPGELDYPTHHQGDFVLVEGATHRVWIANRGLPEYELLDPEGDTRVAVTLHRAVGYLSVGGGRIRPCQAGPSVPTPGAQCLRSLRAELAFGVGTIAREIAIRCARAFAHPAWVREMPYLPYVKGDAETRLPRSGTLLRSENPWILLSALKPTEHDQICVLRVCNLSDRLQTARLQLGFPAAAYCRTTLYETWDESSAQLLSENRIELVLEPYQIASLAIALGN
ncbi:alpha-mannosidase [Rubidibacter lacunae KORDI 51-2]|uniref:Alpha-mannosidase n=1 Tax=Rubidibacter lacunae KORDI 51-2 TaxID=582515 RepID=U5DMN3_9CHRO|nr:glycosyl hydrolase-related protein [Rubidibacter lacunae]ERN40965.1 alpha-mannosidase [Rubidibacter lacunae KORDI 51-2]